MDMTYMNECIHDMFVTSIDLSAPCANRCLGVGREDDKCMVDTTTYGKALIFSLEIVMAIGFSAATVTVIVRLYHI